MTIRRILAPLCMGLLTWGVAGAQAGGKPVNFHIEAQPIRLALQEFGQQAGLQVSMRLNGKAAEQFRVPAVSGELTAQQALERMLANSGLKYEFVNDRAVRISAAAANAAPPNPDSDAGKSESPKPPTSDPPGPTQGAPREDPASSSPDPSSRSSYELQEIVVTAQKRVERLQDVPISISVLDGARLDRSTDRGVADELNRVPGVVGAISNASARSNLVSAVVVRGVAPVPGAGGNSSTTGYYLDSIPFGFMRRADAPDSSAYDLQRVEVLRGPQGTLYGVSALNGVVRVLTKDADLNAFEFKARTSGASTRDGEESYRGDAVVNVPLIEGKLGARAVVGYHDLGGWIDKPIGKNANDGEIGNFRLKLNAQPNEKLSAGLSTWLSRSEFGAPSVSPDNRSRQSVTDEPSSIDFDAHGLKIAYEFSRFSLTSMTSYLDFEARSTVDFAPLAALIGTGFVTLNTTNASEVFSQELVFNSTQEGAWRWSLGGIYRDAEEQLYQTRTDPRTDVLCCTYFAPSDQRTFSESFAVFGELTRGFLDGRFELTGGLRYFEDKVTDRELSFLGAPSGVPAAGLARSNSTFDHVSPRVVLNWHPRTQTTVYASYAEGFRSGLNQLPAVRRVAPDFPAVNPDELRSYEVGAKGSLWEGRIVFDAAAFYIDWQDVQQSLLVPVTAAISNNALVNAGSASGPGAELGLTATPVDGLTVSANFSWNDLQVDSDIFTGTTLLFPEGSRLVLSPERTVSLSADYRFPLGGSGLWGRIAAAANYLPSVIVSRTNATVFSTSDDIRNVRASLGIDASGRWSAMLFADNLGNERGLTARDPLSPQWDTRLRPRTIGLQVEFQFQ
jgi:iron complex outermembrane recepter protein